MIVEVLATASGRVIRFLESHADAALQYAEQHGLDVDWSNQVRTDVFKAGGERIFVAPIVGTTMGWKERALEAELALANEQMKVKALLDVAKGWLETYEAGGIQVNPGVVGVGWDPKAWDEFLKETEMTIARGETES